MAHAAPFRGTAPHRAEVKWLEEPYGEGALIHSRYGIGRKKSPRPANTRQDRPPVSPSLVTNAHYSSPKCRHRQVIIEHRSAAKHGAPKLPAAAQQRCSQSPRRAAAARLSGGGWRSPEGVRARTVHSARHPRKCSGGLRFRQMLHRDQPATATFQSKHLGVAQALWRLPG